MDRLDDLKPQREDLQASKEDRREKKQFWTIVISSIVLFWVFVLIAIFFK